MKLHWSPRSPFVRKVMIVAHECGLVDRIACVRTVAATSKPHAELMKDNPLSKIPTLMLDDGTVIYNSPVICEYLDALDGAPKLFPREPKVRLEALRRQALGDGFLDLLVLLRDERMRAQPSEPHKASAAVRKTAILKNLEADASAMAVRAVRHRPHRHWLRIVVSGFSLCRRGLAQGSSAPRKLARDIHRSPIGESNRAG